MSRRTALRAGIVATLAGGALAASALGIGSTPAFAAQLPVDIDLGYLVPGVTSTGSITMDIPVPARITSTAWTERDDRVDWQATLCSSPSACTPVRELVGGRVITPGHYTVVVGATLADDAAQGGDVNVRAAGSFVLVEAPASELAATGTEILWWVIPAAVASLTAGVVLLLVGRRRPSGHEGGTGVSA